MVEEGKRETNPFGCFSLCHMDGILNTARGKPITHTHTHTHTHSLFHIPTLSLSHTHTVTFRPARDRNNNVWRQMTTGFYKSHAFIQSIQLITQRRRV